MSTISRAEYTITKIYDGEAGVGIVSSPVSYKIHDSGTIVPGETGWSENPPAPVKGKYLWVRTLTTYSDGEIIPTYSVSYYALDGDKGSPGKGIQETIITYLHGDSGSEAPTGEWLPDVPPPEKGKYLWTRTFIQYTEGESSVAYSTSYYPLDGEKGDSGDPAVTYFIENMSTRIQRDVRTKELTPNNFTILGRKRIADGPAVPFSGYFVVYEQVRESISVDDFTEKVIQKDLEEGSIVVHSEPFPFVETYRSTSPESELDYTIKGDPLGIQVHWYIDTSFSERIASQEVLVTDNGTIDYVSEEIERTQNTAGIQVGLKVGYSGFTTRNANSVYLCGMEYDYATGKMQLVDEPGKIYIRHLGETHPVPNQPLNTTGLPSNTTAYIIYDHTKKTVYYVYFETKLSSEGIESKRWRDISGNTIKLNESLFAIGEVST